MSEPQRTQIYNFPAKQRPLTAAETRMRFAKARAEWDEEWGGKCPYSQQAAEQEARYDQQGWFYDGDIDTTKIEWPQRTRLQKLADGFVTTIAIGSILFGVLVLMMVIEMVVI